MSTGLAIADQAVRNKEPIKFNPYAIYNIVNEMQSIRISENMPDYIYSLTEDPLERAKLLKKYDGKSALDVFFLELPRNHPAKKYYYAILASAPAEVTMGNVITHFDGDMEMFLNEANAKMSATDDGFDFEEIGSGETGSLKSLAEKAKQSGVDLALVTMKKESTIGQLADAVLVLPGTTKEENDRETASFAQPMGSAFEQLAFLTFDGMVLNLMDELSETSEKMFARHADFE